MLIESLNRGQNKSKLFVLSSRIMRARKTRRGELIKRSGTRGSRRDAIAELFGPRRSVLVFYCRAVFADWNRPWFWPRGSKSGVTRDKKRWYKFPKRAQRPRPRNPVLRSRQYLLLSADKKTCWNVRAERCAGTRPTKCKNRGPREPVLNFKGFHLSARAQRSRRSRVTNCIIARRYCAY